MGKSSVQILREENGIGPLIDKATAQKLSRIWIESSNYQRDQIVEENDIDPVFSRIRGGEIKLGVMKDLQEEPSKIIPGLDEEGNLVLVTGFPVTRVYGPRHFASMKTINESRQFQLRAYTEDGKEEVSDWYDSEDKVHEMKKQIDELEKYESTSVIKRIKEMDHDESNTAKPTLEAKVRGGPKGKGKPLGTQVHKDKKKEKSKKAARKKVRVKENFDLHEGITSTVLNALERYLDNLFASLGIDINFTKHFLQRVNDERNRRPITYAELNKMFRKVYKKYGKRIARMTDQAQAVITDMSSDINMPFVIKYDTRNQELDLVAKTVMRKKNFMTSNPRLRVEEKLD